MKSKAGPSSKNLDSIAAAEKFLSSTEAGFVGTCMGLIMEIELVCNNHTFLPSCVVGFFDSEETDMAKTFKKAADSLSEKYRFAHSTNEEVSKKYGYEK